MVWLLPVLVVGTGALLWLLSRQVDALYLEMALHGASLQTKTIEEVREVYASDVIERLKKLDVEASHDYVTNDRVVPLPESLMMEIGERLGRDRKGTYIRLFSAFPFPNRKERQLDDFEKEAILRMQVSPGEVFSRFEVFEGRPSIRYAIADRMKPGCLKCHNSHPQSPRTNWKQDDVRGVLEVIRPIGKEVATAHSALLYTINGAVMVYGFGLLGMLLLLQRVHLTSQRLRQTEARTRAIVGNAADGIITFDQHLRIEDFNAAAEVMFGVSAVTVARQEVLQWIVDTDRRLRDFVYHKIIKDADSGSGIRISADVRISSKSLVCEVAGQRKDGTTFPMALSVGVVRWASRSDSPASSAISPIRSGSKPRSSKNARSSKS